MDKKFSFREKLDFNDIDLTAPDKVIEEILSQLSKETNGIIIGKIQSYSGPVFSYEQGVFSEIAEAMQSVVSKSIDIQDYLGEIGEEVHQFECFLYTPEYDTYKYRVFFVKYDIANYPVDIILDESVARSISGLKSGYVHKCNTREDLENLVYDIFNSKRIVTVMQQLIRINQSKKIEKASLEIDDSNETEEK